jgi:exonuclease III
MSRQDRLKEVIENRENNEAFREIRRMLQDDVMLNSYTFLQDQLPSEINIQPSLRMLSHNVRSFMKHRSQIKADYGFQAADLMVFCETRAKATLSTKDLDIPGYDLKFRSGGTSFNTTVGQLCYVRKEAQFTTEIVGQYATKPSNFGIDDPSQISELLLLKLDHQLWNHSGIFVCFVYKHPNRSKKAFLQELEHFLCSHVQFYQKTTGEIIFTTKIFLCGDFNVDFSDDSKAAFTQKFLTLFNLKPSEKMKNFPPTTDKGSCIDMIFENNSSQEVMSNAVVYECTFSDHKPIFLEILN